MQSVPDDSSVLDYSRTPPRLKDLLRREACLLASQEQIETALLEFDERHREVEGSRPPFLFLHRKTVRQQFHQRLSESRQTMEALQKGAAKLAELLPRLHVWIAEEIERHLLAERGVFFHGLARQRFPADWQRLSERFVLEARQLDAGLEALQAALRTLQPEQRLAGQLHIIEQVKLCRALGARVDARIATLNLIAQLQASAGIPRALTETPLLNCETQAARVAMIDDINTRELLSRFVARYRQAVPVVVAALQTQIQIAQRKVSSDLPSYIEACWDALRAYAAQEFNPSHMERLLTETERMLDQHEVP